jgi:anion-transporting  ArsA/GET3 family ATPase
VDPAEFLRASRVVIVAGKGGVGKTTVTAALARRAGRAGLRTLVVELDERPGLATLLGVERFGYEPVDVGEGVEGRTITPDRALGEYLAAHGLDRIARKLFSNGVIDVLSTAAPGIRDILVLGKVKQLEQTDAADLFLVDGPAAGHAVTMLQSAGGIGDAVRGGPLHKQAAEVRDLLTDPQRCSVLLVTTPEETPVNELIETAFALEDRTGVSLGAVVVNGLYPSLDGLEEPTDDEVLRAAAGFRLARMSLQRTEVERLATALPLPQLHLPFLFDADLGPAHVDELVAAL